MKRKRAEMEKFSEVRSAIELLSMIKPDGHISTMAFLGVCHLLLQVLDKIGPTMAVLRQDVNDNIQRIENIYDMDPSTYCNLAEIVRAEAGKGASRKGTGCTRALLWLTSRSMDFSVVLLRKIVDDHEKSLTQLVEDAYQNTLKPWHGWISTAAYKVALKLIPDRKCLLNLLLAEGEEHGMLKEKIKTLALLFLPILGEIHDILVDHLKSLNSSIPECNILLLETKKFTYISCWVLFNVQGTYRLDRLKSA